MKPVAGQSIPEHRPDLTDAVEALLQERGVPERGVAEVVADLFDQARIEDDLALRRCSRTASQIEEVLASIVSAPSYDELVMRACDGASSLCNSRIAVLSHIEHGIATVVSVGREATDRFVGCYPILESSIERIALDCGVVAVQGVGETTSITSLHPGPACRWSVTPVTVDGESTGLLYVDVAVSEPIQGILAAFASALGGCFERTGLEVKRIRQERVLREGVRLWSEDLDDFGAEANAEASGEDAGMRRVGGSAFVPAEPLTDREADVLRAVLTGASNAAIAADLVITVDTVKSHMKKILRKYGAVNRAELIALHG